MAPDMIVFARRTRLSFSGLSPPCPPICVHTISSQHFFNLNVNSWRLVTTDWRYETAQCIFTLPVLGITGSILRCTDAIVMQRHQILPIRISAIGGYQIVHDSIPLSLRWFPSRGFDFVSTGLQCRNETDRGNWMRWLHQWSRYRRYFYDRTVRCR